MKTVWKIVAITKTGETRNSVLFDTYEEARLFFNRDWYRMSVITIWFKEPGHDWSALTCNVNTGCFYK